MLTEDEHEKNLRRTKNILQVYCFHKKNKTCSSFNYKHTQRIHLPSLAFHLHFPGHTQIQGHHSATLIKNNSNKQPFYTNLLQSWYSYNHYLLLLLPITARYSHIYSCIQCFFFQVVASLSILLKWVEKSINIRRFWRFLLPFSLDTKINATARSHSVESHGHTP